MRNFEWRGNRFSGVERSLAGYAGFELSQWDPFIGNKACRRPRHIQFHFGLQLTG